MFSEFFENEPQVMLHPSQTRWLSFYFAVERIIRQWEALKVFFQRIRPYENLLSIDNIVNGMNNKSVYLYLQFLYFILPILKNFNVLFQRESPTIFLVDRKIKTLYRTTLEYFCRHELITSNNLENFNPRDQTNWRPLELVYLGTKIHCLLNTEEYRRVDPQTIKNVRIRCREFYIKLCEEIKKRFEINDPLLQMISFFDPKNILKRDTRVQLPTLSDLLALTPRIYHGDWQILDE